MPKRRDMLEAVARRFGTPYFVYFLDEVRDRLDMLREAFGDRFLISYAVKSNPNPTILNWLRGFVAALDISSGGELRRALAAGWTTDRISFTGPAKRHWELVDSVAAGVAKLVLESVREAEDLNVVAKEAGCIQPVLLRVAPASLPRGFGVNMAGKPTQFGVDEEDALDAIREILRLDHLRLIGFHAYSGTQCLDATAVGENLGNFARIFRALARTADIHPDALVFGAGFGIPYHEDSGTLNISAVARAMAPVFDELDSDSRIAGAKLYLEMGRFLVGEAGLYVTRVTRLKQSRGNEIAICDGGMNHHLGACGHLGSVIHRNYRIFKVSGEISHPNRRYELVGPLCTSIDRLGHAIELPELHEGDLLAVHCSGAYGLTASPVNFISHEPPREFAVEGADIREITDARVGAIWRPAEGPVQ
jgi:diaminopimelate decarboxylase